MTALLTGFLLVAYILATGAIYRLVFSFYIPAKRFVRSRTEEIIFSVIVTILPFALACLLLFFTPLGRLPRLTTGGSKRASQSAVLNSVLPGSDAAARQVSAAYLRVFEEQLRFLAWLWLFTALEGWAAGALVNRYGDFAADSRLKRLCEKTLLRHVSEWQILFTTFALPAPDKHLAVVVDVLTTLDVLYRGRLADWTLDADGKLAGVFLTGASRFARELLDHDRSAGTHEPSESYWRPIPGARLYLVASTIANYNIRYVDPTRAEPQFTDDLLGEDMIITPLPAEDTEDP